MSRKVSLVLVMCLSVLAFWISPAAAQDTAPEEAAEKVKSAAKEAAPKTEKKQPTKAGQTPDVTGLNYYEWLVEAAEGVSARWELVPLIETAHDSSEGAVLDQSPKPGERLPQSGVIYVMISIGPDGPVSNGQTPSFIGMSDTEALEKGAAAGLTVIPYFENEELIDGEAHIKKIDRQLPNPGAPLPSFGEVIVIGVGDSLFDGAPYEKSPYQEDPLAAGEEDANDNATLIAEAPGASPDAPPDARDDTAVDQIRSAIDNVYSDKVESGALDGVAEEAEAPGPFGLPATVAGVRTGWIFAVLGALVFVFGIIPLAFRLMSGGGDDDDDEDDEEPDKEPVPWPPDFEDPPKS